MGTRRSFFADLVGLVLSSAVPEVGENGKATEPVLSWLRPPGALPKKEFLRACTQCTDCQEACPYQSIRRLGPEFGAAAGTPAVIPDESPCYLCADMPCITACEPGALIATPVEAVSMGTVVLSTEACYVAQGQPCDYCTVRCPLGERAIAVGADGVPQIDPSGCAGCGVCAYLCPADALRVNPARG